MSGNTSTDIWIAGAFAAFSVDLLVYPLDTLKTRLQSPDYKKLYVNESSNTIKKAALFRGLYQGLGTIILATLPSSGAFFTTYEGSKSILTRFNPPSLFHPADNNGSRPGFVPQPLVHSAASAIAECVSCAILTPAEVIKQNAQMVSKESTRRTGSSATAQTLKKFRGNPLALWRGYSALVGRNLPFVALQFPMFERLKASLRHWRESKRSNEDQIPLWEHGAITALAAGSAGAVAAVVTTPVDVVKTRIMLAAAEGGGSQDSTKAAVEAAKQGKIVDALGSVKPRSSAKRKSSWTVAKEVISDQGWKGLMRGGALRGVWTMLGSGLYLGVYESGRLFLERRRERLRDD